MQCASCSTVTRAIPPPRSLLVLNLFLSIAVAKYVAFYPVLIDAGAIALVTLAIYFLVTGPRAAAAVAILAAVLAREFAIATVAFGVVRDLRRRVPVWIIAATYAPALAVFFVWRSHVTQRFSGNSVPNWASPP